MNRHGFSRLEAILVLSVAALLAAALFPIVAHRRVAQRGELCQDNLKRIGLYVRMYAQDFDDIYPLIAVNDVATTVNLGGNHYPMPFGWADATEPYVSSQTLGYPPFLCAAEKQFNVDAPSQSGYTDFWLNRNLAGRSVLLVYYSEQTLLSGDGDGGSPLSNARYAIKSLPKSWLSTPGSPARRHFDGANYAFADGHVKWLRPQQITLARPDKKHPVNTFALG